MTNEIVGERLTTYLTVLVEHLRANPHLPVFTMHSLWKNKFDLQLNSGKHATANLLAWADTLDEVEFSIAQIDSDAHVHVTGRIPHNAIDVEVWTSVAELSGWSGREGGLSADDFLSALEDHVNEKVEENA